MTTEDREQLYNTSLTRLRHSTYTRQCRAITLLWGLFVLVCVILNVLVFLQPQWIGDTGESAVAGYFGAWEYCQEPAPGLDYTCSGDFLVWDSILSGAFKATSLLVGVSCLLLLTSLACCVLFCVLSARTVLRLCAVFQASAGVLLLVGALVYPLGWDHPTVRAVCGGEADQYSLGVCSVRWGLVLCFVLVLCLALLCGLALVLAAGAVSLAPQEGKEKNKN